MKQAQPGSSISTWLRSVVFVAMASLTFGLGARPTAAYTPKITKADIIAAGGYCVAERCYLNGRAYHCVNGRCVAAT